RDEVATSAEGMYGSLRHLVKPILEKISVATRTWTASLKPTNSSLVPTSLKTWYPRSLLLTAKGKVPYAYYRCTGSDAYRFGGQRLCWNKQIRTDVLDAAVWEDVRHLLSEPERVRAEYERRLQGPETGPEREVKHLNKMITNLKKMISRLIDAYGDGLLDKSEFEPRILAARERLAKLEDECRQRIDEANQEVELRLVIGQ